MSSPQNSSGPSFPSCEQSETIKKTLPNRGTTPEITEFENQLNKPSSFVDEKDLNINETEAREAV